MKSAEQSLFSRERVVVSIRDPFNPTKSITAAGLAAAHGGPYPPGVIGFLPKALQVRPRSSPSLRESQFQLLRFRSAFADGIDQVKKLFPGRNVDFFAREFSWSAAGAFDPATRILSNGAAFDCVTEQSAEESEFVFKRELGRFRGALRQPVLTMRGGNFFQGNVCKKRSDATDVLVVAFDAAGFEIRALNVEPALRQAADQDGFRVLGFYDRKILIALDRFGSDILQLVQPFAQCALSEAAIFNRCSVLNAQRGTELFASALCRP